MNYNPYFYNPSILGQQPLVCDSNGMQAMCQPIIANNNQNHFALANNMYQTNNKAGIKQNYKFNENNSIQKNLANNMNNISVGEEPQNRGENNKISNKFKANKKKKSYAATKKKRKKMNRSPKIKNS